MLNAEGIRMIMNVPVLAGRKKPYVRPKSYTKAIAAPRPCKARLDKVVSLLKDNGPMTRERIQLMMGITKPYMFTCAKHLQADGVLFRSFPDGKGPGKSVVFSLKGV